LENFYKLKASADIEDDRRKSKEYFDREFGIKSTLFSQNIICYPVEIIPDPPESDEEENEPTEEEIIAAMALLNRSKKRKEKLNNTEKLNKSGDEPKVTTEEKLNETDYPQVLVEPTGASATGVEEVLLLFNNFCPSHSEIKKHCSVKIQEELVQIHLKTFWIAALIHLSYNFQHFCQG